MKQRFIQDSPSLCRLGIYTAGPRPQPVSVARQGGCSGGHLHIYPRRQRSAALAQALEELHADGDAHVPAQWDETDVAGHDGRPQQVLH